MMTKHKKARNKAKKEETYYQCLVCGIVGNDLQFMSRMCSHDQSKYRSKKSD